MPALKEKQVMYSVKIRNKIINVTGRKKNNRGYVLLYTKNHPRSGTDGYVMEHRLVMEMFLDRFLEDFEDVHHKNEVKHDNRIDNLELIKHREHTILHNLGTKFSEETKKRISDAAKKRFSNKKNHPSYKDVDIELTKMFNEGKYPTEISKTLNISRKAVYNKIKYLGLRRYNDK